MKRSNLGKHITPTVRAFRGLFESLIRDGGIEAGNAVENPVEGDLTAGGIAALQD